MSTRRSRGEGGLHWDESRQRWIATVTLGFDARGKPRRGGGFDFAADLAAEWLAEHLRRSNFVLTRRRLATLGRLATDHHQQIRAQHPRPGR